MTTAEVAERVRQARAEGTPLRIVGGGGWLDAGAPCAAVQRLELGGLRGITDYEPGDLTLTARAGTTLADIASATAAHGQWLPLDPPGSAAATLGATIATASYGPLAAAYGTPRDQVLGCEVVTGAGAVVQAGGRVVKNVAGFDLVRLMVGAWGTLGALTAATVRLRARPEVDATVAIALGGQDGVAHAWRWLRTSEFTPLAAELLSPELASRLGVHSLAPVLLLRLGGNESLVRAALSAATMLGDGMPLDPGTWQRLATAESAGSSTLRLSAAPSRIAELWRAAYAVAPRGALLHASLTRGVLRCMLPAGEDGGTMRQVMLPGYRCIGERLPADLWRAPAADPVTSSLTLGVRRAFDPDHLLNPGIMGSISGGVA